MKEYALYKGEELLHIGTVEEIAEAHGVTVGTIKFYRTPTYKRRVDRLKNPHNATTIVELDLDDDE